MQDDEEDLSYDIGSLFTNILIEETTNCIIEQIYIQKKLTPICSKLIFTKLLVKHTTVCTFKFNNTFLKHMMVTLWMDHYLLLSYLLLSICCFHTYMTKMENDIVIPSKPIFHSRFVKDIYIRKKKWDNVFFNSRLNNYHLNIKITIELNPNKFLNTKFANINGACKFNVCQKKVQNDHRHEPPNLQNTINEMQSKAIFIVQKEFHQILMKKSP